MFEITNKMQDLVGHVFVWVGLTILWTTI